VSPAYQELAAHGVSFHRKMNFLGVMRSGRTTHERGFAVNSSLVRTMFATMAVMLVTACVFSTRSAQSTSTTTSQAAPKPLLLEKSEGERRIWREPPPGDFILKVSPQNNGSQHLVMGTEDMHPGDEFPTHTHLGQDEILYIVKGTVHVHLGDREGDLHSGGTVFIPAHTWVDAKNAGTETVSLIFVFSAPGFENYMRCDSVLPNEKVVPLSLEEQRACADQGHVVYKDLEKNPKK
jgi:quercetin dioxygenase-like cupin family protein